MKPIGNLFNRVKGAAQVLGFGSAAPPSPKKEVYPSQGDIAWADGSFFGRQPMEKWNPDDLIARRGYGVLRKMVQDDQIRALLRLKTAMITSRGYHFSHSQTSAPHQECARFFEFMVSRLLEGSFSSALAQMLSSQTAGFSVTEKIYTPCDWQGRTLWGVNRLKTRPASTFVFETDPHGNLTGLIQMQGGNRVNLPVEKFILHVNNPEGDPHYGESDLRACYRHWWAKDNILKFWNIYLERMASGFVHGRVSGPLTPAERDELRQVMQNLSTQTSVITPASVELHMVTAPSTDAFERAVAARDKAMAKALLVPNLLGFSEQGDTGSYSQSQTHLEAFFLVMNAMAESLADVLNEQLFRELARWNFGLENPPLFAFDPLTESQKRDLASAWREAVGGGVVTQTPADEARTRHLLGYPALHPSPTTPTSESSP